MIPPAVKAAAELLRLLKQAKKLAKRYRELTGRPLGVTGEIAEAEAVSLLKLELAPPRTAGYDVIRRTPAGIQRLQVKGRVVLSKKMAGQRMGTINIKHNCDAVLLVLLDQDYNTTRIYEAPRKLVVKEIKRPGSKARNQRGALSISTFCNRLARQVWPRE